MDAIWAEDELRSGQGLTPDRIYRLKLLATGDEREAAQARADAKAEESKQKFMHEGT